MPLNSIGKQSRWSLFLRLLRTLGPLGSWAAHLLCNAWNLSHVGNTFQSGLKTDNYSIVVKNWLGQSLCHVGQNFTFKQRQWVIWETWDNFIRHLLSSTKLCYCQLACGAGKKRKPQAFLHAGAGHKRQLMQWSVSAGTILTQCFSDTFPFPCSEEYSCRYWACQCSTLPLQHPG